MQALSTDPEASFSSANIEQEVDLNGVPLHVQLFPAAVDISPDGVRLQMNGDASRAPAAAAAQLGKLLGPYRNGACPVEVC